MSDKVQILFQSSPEFKEALGTFAQQNNIASSEVIRVAVSQYIGYDISRDPITSGRPKKYATKEERLEAQKNKAKESRQTLKMLLEDFERAQRRGDVKTMEEWVAMRKKQGKWTAGDD